MGNIVLYDHNKNAYENVIEQLESFERTCVIHPTGTGKSYIGFALVEDNPDKHFLWISPNEYIYNTQVQNLKEDQRVALSNVEFHTYAWIMRNKNNLEELKPDCIILDEFHRAGAVEWGKSLDILFEVYPKVKVLGLTATNIRYLDHQRDMAAEIFDNHIASYMSVEEALVKRILPTPKYIISVYSYKENLSYYKKRINQIKNKYKKEESLAILERLKRRLENALGVEQIFAKHIKNKNGKYIIFCSNTDHMFEMMAQVPLWFCYIDRRPHIYHIYSHNPESEKDFSEFLNDDSSHLKLLFAIDMLNEGIHVDCIDGVILLRPTISPIVYKQQIGRALAAGRKGTPLIFDMVNNFDSLYNINSFKEEVDSAYVTYEGIESGNKNISFEIIDELKNCRELIGEIHRNIDISWDEYYESLCRYKNNHGNINVPVRYIDSNNLYLGRWLDRQKAAYRENHLEAAQIVKLELLGICWEKVKDQSFENWFRLLCEYKEEYGDLKVPSRYVTPSGENLGNWCYNIRGRYRLGKVPEARIKRMEEIGFVWRIFNVQWQEGYEHALSYYNEHGNIDVVKRYICEDGYKLGLWIYTQRRVRSGKVKGDMNEEKIAALDEIGMQWTVSTNDRFEEYIEGFVRFKKEYSTCKIPSDFVDSTGLPLGQWSYRMKRLKRENKLPEYKKNKLDELGFIWNNYNGIWYKHYEEAKAYYEKNGSLSISKEYTKEHGAGLAGWLNNQKREYRKSGHGNLTDDQVKLLKDIEIEFRNKSDVSWIKGLTALREYVDCYGDTLVPTDYINDEGYGLGRWVGHIKTDYNNGVLPEIKIKVLNQLGMCWENTVNMHAQMHWNKMYEEAKKYYIEHGDLHMPYGYVTENGCKLYMWLMQQRRIKRGEIKHSIQYTDDRINLMEKIGMKW